MVLPESESESYAKTQLCKVAFEPCQIYMMELFRGKKLTAFSCYLFS